MDRVTPWAPSRSQKWRSILILPLGAVTHSFPRKQLVTFNITYVDLDLYIPCISHIFLIRDARGTINSFNDHCFVVLCPRKIEYKPKENFSGLISPEGTMNIGWLIGKLRKREEGVCELIVWIGSWDDVGGTDILKFWVSKLLPSLTTDTCLMNTIYRESAIF